MPAAALPKHGNYDLRSIKAKVCEKHRNRKDSFVQLQAGSFGEQACRLLNYCKNAIIDQILKSKAGVRAELLQPSQS